MKKAKRENKFFVPRKQLIMVVGNYGSGKTEVSVNLAISLRRQGRKVQIADLDIVNPYFRCREARMLMRSMDIRVVVPPGEQVSADLPIVLPEIAGMLSPREGEISIFDVGGDDVGARLLSSFAKSLDKIARAQGENEEPPYELLQVINARRPFTDTVEGCLSMRNAIEGSSRLKVTGLIGNTHLMDETSPQTILEGWALTKEVSRRSGLPVAFVAVMENLKGAGELGAIDSQLFYLKRYMLPPWLANKTENTTDSTVENEASLPAPRTVPIGRPSGVQ